MTASVQQQVTKTAAVSVAYVGSLSRHLPMSVDENYPVFNTTTPSANTTANANTRRPYYNMVQMCIRDSLCSASRHRHEIDLSIGRDGSPL